MAIETQQKPQVEMLTLGVGGMTCASCVARVERALKKVPGVDRANVNLATEKATVAFDAASVPVGSLLQAIEAAGYEPRRETLVFDVVAAAADSQLEQTLRNVRGVIGVDFNAEAHRLTVTF